MTAKQIAASLHGVRAGKRWMCRCPNSRLHAHGDRNRSLSIGEKDGWVTLKCFTGCEREEILAAMGLRLRDLALNEMPTRADFAKMERERAAEERERTAIRRKWRRELEQAIFWRDRRNELGKMLYESPESNKIASLFHAACFRAASLSDSEFELFGKVKWANGLTKKMFHLERV